MKKELTNCQRKMLIAIIDYKKKYEYAPTVRELCDLLGYTSSGSVHAILKALKNKGYISYIENKSRTIKVLKNEEDILFDRV